MNIKYLLFLAAFLVCPSSVYSQQVNIELGPDGQIEEINYKNISKDYKSTILAQLVSDDVIKKAKSLAKAERYHEAHQLLNAVTYLDYNNTTSLILASSYLQKNITNENDRKKIFKNFTFEVSSALKRKQSSHNIDLKRGLVIANEAKSLYSENTEEFKVATSLIEQLKKYMKQEEVTIEVLSKLRNRAEKSKQQGKHIQAINNFAILYYDENVTTHDL